jgi:hypothetical protein
MSTGGSYTKALFPTRDVSNFSLRELAPLNRSRQSRLARRHPLGRQLGDKNGMHSLLLSILQGSLRIPWNNGIPGVGRRSSDAPATLKRTLINHPSFHLIACLFTLWNKQIT